MPGINQLINNTIQSAVMLGLVHMHLRSKTIFLNFFPFAARHLGYNKSKQKILMHRQAPSQQNIYDTETDGRLSHST